MKTKRFSHESNGNWSHLDEAQKLDSPNTLVTIFCSPYYKDHPEVFTELKTKFPQSIVVGCSTSGEIHENTIQDLSISGVALQFDNSKLALSEFEISKAEESFSAGKHIAKTLMADDLKGILVISDGLCGNGTELTKGLNSILGDKDITVAGGLAGDGNSFESTWVIHQGELRPGLVLGVGLYGESLQITSSSDGGWDMFGPERQITKSMGSVLFEIDGRPALDLYKEYLGEKATDLPASGLLFPLQIRSSKASDHRLVRTLLAVSEEDNSMTFAGDLPEGHLVQLMRANFERLIDAAGDVGEQIRDSEEKSSESSFSFAISCVGRRLVLGARAEEELEALEESLGNKNFIGFYSYGEIGPVHNGESCDLHNQSMTVMQIREADAQSEKKAG